MKIEITFRKSYYFDCDDEFITLIVIVKWKLLFYKYILYIYINFAVNFKPFNFILSIKINVKMKTQN